MNALLDELLRHVEKHSEELSYSFVRDSSEEERVTWLELWQRVCAASAAIREFAHPGDRALLAYPPGLDFVTGLLGCMHAGVTAVPVYPPTLSRKWDRIEAIVADADPVVAIASADVPEALEATFPKPEWVDRLRWIQADGKEKNGAPVAHADAQPALIQYTSGSTGRPKGVMLTTANLVANTKAIGRLFGASGEERAVFWLPPYHDMGLIGGILASLAHRVPTTLMSPAAFLRRPFRWLEIMTRVSGSISGAPNFAYALCERRVREEDLERLNLRSWRIAFCGAEPIQPEVLERFVNRFARCGLDRRALYPCYGLAEATLMVTGGLRGAGMKTLTVDSAALETERKARVPSGSRSRELVGCGRPVDDLDIRIVDPETCREVSTGSVGEIWVHGPSVAAGYWRKPLETAETFQARLMDGRQDRQYLRSGDLGFWGEDRELFVTGRIKDILIVAGRNLYPEDLEWTASRSHKLLAERRSAAFAMDGGVVLVHEVDAITSAEELGVARLAVTRALFDAHGIHPQRVVFVRPHDIPVTTSGKIQRAECRNRLQQASLKELPWTAAGKP